MNFITILLGILLFLFLITIHEAGHFFGAKSSGIKVNEFSIGMGPSLIKKQGEETLYSLRALPVGGYVMMEGEEQDSNDKRAYNNAPAYKRFITIFAGPAVNIIFSIIIFFIISLFYGHASTEISSLEPNKPAQQSGLQVGDKILSVNGRKTSFFAEVAEQIEKSNGAVNLLIDKSGEKKEIKVKPEIVNERKIIGFKPLFKRDFLSSFVYAFSMTLHVSILILKALAGLFTGKVGLDNLSGQVGVIQQVGQSARLGLQSFLNFSAMISINLGIFNLLPIPALDGFKLVFIIFEMITGKKVNKTFEERITITGFLILMAFMLFVTAKDVISIF